MTTRPHPRAFKSRQPSKHSRHDLTGVSQLSIIDPNETFAVQIELIFGRCLLSNGMIIV
jgi:hypothetical protein